MTAITGNTYPHRAEFRAMGGQWDAGAKAWMVPDEKADEARALLTGGNAGRRRTTQRQATQYRGGHDLTKYGSGRGYLGTDENGHAHFGTRCNCEDYPCCGH